MMKRDISANFLSDMFDSLQYDSATIAPQYELKSFVTMATTGFQASPILKAFLSPLGSIFELFFVQKIPLSRRVGYVMGGSVSGSVSGSVRDVCMSQQSDWMYY